MKRGFQFLLIHLVMLVAMVGWVSAQQNSDSSASADNPLVKLLQSKGIITEQEALMVNSASSRTESDERLARLLLSKGLISREEYDQTIIASTADAAGKPRAVPASLNAADAVTAGSATETAAQPANASIAKSTSKPGDGSAKGSSQGQPQSEGLMTTLSKVPVKIYGNILFNANWVDRGANTIDIPLFSQRRDVSADQNHQNFNATIRQTRFGLRYEGKIFNDAKLTGVFEFDLLGGKPAFSNGVNFDIFRIRLAYGRIDWANDSIEAGQDWAVFSPLNPTSLASYAIPAFSTSGNLWNRIPQFRYEHRASIGEKSKFIFDAALLDPNGGDSVGNPAVRVIGLGERGAMPAYEMRLGFTTPTAGKESSFGVSGHYSRLLAAPGNPSGTLVRSPIDSYGVSGEFNLWLSSGFRVTGEAFHGRALGIFSGDIAQSAVVIAGRARGINSTGGWVEVHGEAPSGYQGAWKNVSANVGYGIEDNREQDLLTGLRKRNQSIMANWQYKFSPNFTFALEYRHVLTDWTRQPFFMQRLNWGDVAFLYSF